MATTTRQEATRRVRSTLTKCTNPREGQTRSKRMCPLELGMLEPRRILGRACYALRQAPDSMSKVWEMAK
jgi:hypothetical protein